MNSDDGDIWLAGVDGCPDGWIVAFGRPDGEVKPPRVVTRFKDILDAPEQPTIIAVDVPIGLPEQSPVKGRLAEATVRPLMGKLKSSVFRIPSRRAVNAALAAEPSDRLERYAHACKIARETSDDQKAFGIQTFCILDKVGQVDTLLRSNPMLARRVYETHPELAFVKMNGDISLDEPKKRHGRPHQPGLNFRRTLLAAAHIPRALLDMPPPKGAADDDMIDAFACLVTARKIRAGRAQPHPNPPPCDEFDLPMAIWA